MDAPITATDPIPLPFPEPARARRWPAAITSVLTALVVNVLILASFLFVTVH